MGAASARLIFSSEARAFLCSGVSLFVRTRSFDTRQNSADNSHSLRFCSSKFEIRRMFSSSVSDPPSGAFLADADHINGGTVGQQVCGSASARIERATRLILWTTDHVDLDPESTVQRDRTAGNGCFKRRAKSSLKREGLRFRTYPDYYHFFLTVNIRNLMGR
jgi:hypothetical protein